MTDTVRLANYLPEIPDDAELTARGWKRRFSEQTGDPQGWLHNQPNIRTSPYLGIFKVPGGRLALTARVSLPGFYRGSNVSLLNESEIVESLNELTAYIHDNCGFSFDSLNAEVWEVHFARDVFVGEQNIETFMQKFSEINLPQLERGKYSQKTLYYHSKGRGREGRKPRTLCIYPKMADCIAKRFSKCDIEKAAGVVRIEIRYKKRKAVERLCKNLSISAPTAIEVLTREAAEAILGPICAQADRIIQSLGTPGKIERLVGSYGHRRTASLVQFLVYRDNFGDDFYRIKSLNYSRSAYYAAQADCRALGIWSLREMDPMEKPSVAIP